MIILIVRVKIQFYKFKSTFRNTFFRNAMPKVVLFSTCFFIYFFIY